jgi:hypothetical protein
VGWKDENGEAVKYKGTSAVKRVINPQRFISKSRSKGRSQ